MLLDLDFWSVGAGIDVLGARERVGGTGEGEMEVVWDMSAVDERWSCGFPLGSGSFRGSYEAGRGGKETGLLADTCCFSL